MTLIVPVCPGVELPVMIYAKDQPQYNQLPCFRDDDGTVVTRWKLTWRERLRILFYGNLWLTVLTFNKPLQPVKLETKNPITSSSIDDDGSLLVKWKLAWK